MAPRPPFIRAYTQPTQAQTWLRQMAGQRPLVALVLGFTETALIPGISAAGATPAHRRYTALADGEFMVNGPQPQPTYALPPLQAGVSPAILARAVVADLALPLQVFNAGLPTVPVAPALDLGASSARCLTTGQAMALAQVEHLFTQGLHWGNALAALVPNRYLVVGECVVGGTTTALAVLEGLGIDAAGLVNSSHPTCNHDQKQQVVAQGLAHWQARQSGDASAPSRDPLALVAAVGDPMQPFVAGLALGASPRAGVLLAGGSQMLAVFALTAAIAAQRRLPWHPQQVVVGTTRWVAEDPTGHTVALAQRVGACLLATPLSFQAAQHPALRVYEQGFVKEGVGAGGCCIAAALMAGWGQGELLSAIEGLVIQQLAMQPEDGRPVKPA